MKLILCSDCGFYVEPDEIEMCHNCGKEVCRVCEPTHDCEDAGRMIYMIDQRVPSTGDALRWCIVRDDQIIYHSANWLLIIKVLEGLDCETSEVRNAT